jgi:hypothetical protein
MDKDGTDEGGVWRDIFVEIFARFFFAEIATGLVEVG